MDAGGPLELGGAARGPVSVAAAGGRFRGGGGTARPPRVIDNICSRRGRAVPARTRDGGRAVPAPICGDGHEYRRPGIVETFQRDFLDEPGVSKLFGEPTHLATLHRSEEHTSELQ